MDFSPSNSIVKLCLQGIALEEKGLAADARKLFREAWGAATDDHEKFISGYFFARSQAQPSERLAWFKTALQIALNINNDTVKSALRPLYSNIAQCHEDLGNAEDAKRNAALAASVDERPTDRGPFFHGTKADLPVGELLRAGQGSNYKADLKVNHIYFTALPNGAGLAASMAKGEQRERVYVVEPTGPFEDDPNVTNKKFPGNPTRSYRSQAPLRIVGEVLDWTKQTPEELRKWREKVDGNKGEIIN